MAVASDFLFFKLSNGESLIIIPDNKEDDGSRTNTFQLYYGNRSNMDKCLSNLNNYSGLISFDRSNQEFYYTPGNLPIPDPEILRMITLIKSIIY